MKCKRCSGNGAYEIVSDEPELTMILKECNDCDGTGVTNYD